MGDRLPVLFREFMLPWDGVERRESLEGGGLAGSGGAAPTTEHKLFFLLVGGMRAVGRWAGTGSFSSARYTRCMACHGTRQTQRILSSGKFWKKVGKICCVWGKL